MKTKPSLIPADALLRVADLLTRAGQGKHSDEKWKTMSVQEHVDAVFRHLLKHNSGETVDQEYLHTHLVHAAARLLMAVSLQGAQTAFEGRVVECRHLSKSPILPEGAYATGGWRCVACGKVFPNEAWCSHMGRIIIKGKFGGWECVDCGFEYLP